MEGCAGTFAEALINCVYKPNEGSCGDSEDWSSWYCEATEMYLYRSPVYANKWIFYTVCGVDSGGWGYGDVVGDPPLISTHSWTCNTNGAYAYNNPMTITCSLYEGQHTTCLPGTYNASSTGPEGHCFPCPAHLESSFPGATSVDDCFTKTANLFTVSDTSDRVVATNGDSDQYELIHEGGVVARPLDIEFVTEDEFIMTMNSRGVVERMNSEGTSLGTFATVSSPVGLIHLPEFNMVGVASQGGDGKIYFFSLAEDYFYSGGQGEPLTQDDAIEVSMVAGATDPLYMTIGEKSNEILVTTENGRVSRICVPSSRCNAAARNTEMAYGGGQYLRGIGVLKSKNTYLVADRGREKIFECPLTLTTSTYLPNCPVFAYMPKGASTRQRLPQRASRRSSPSR